MYQYHEFTLKKIITIILIVGLGCFIAKFVINIDLNIIAASNVFIKYLKTSNYRKEYALFSTKHSSERTDNKKAVSAQSIPVLLYHGIPNKPDGQNIILSDFQKQMFALKQAGYQTITLTDFELFLNGQKQLSSKSFLLTFDDGRRDSYENADPILSALDYNAVMFIITKSSLGKKRSRYYLSQEDITQMLQSRRWQIGSHSQDGHVLYAISSVGSQGHFYSNKLWLNDKNRVETDEEFRTRITNDLKNSQQAIDQALHITADTIAYPFGDYGNKSVNFPASETIVLEESKKVYRLGFYQTWVGNGYISNLAGNNIFLAKRITVEHNWSPEYLINLLDSFDAVRFPYVADFRNNLGGWINLWGVVEATRSGLLVSSGSNTSGFAVLPKSIKWSNSKINVDILHQAGQSVALITRYADDQNYLSCEYSGNFVYLNQVAGGKARNLVTVGNVINHHKTRFTFTLDVKNTELTCYINGRFVASARYLDPSIRSGMVGIKTWDPSFGVAKVEVFGAKAE